MSGTQMILDLGHRPALGREDFLVAPSNQVAVDWIDRWPDWPQPGLALHGEPGAGKSHLTRVWQAASGARLLDPEDFRALDPPELLGEAQTCVLDEAERLFEAESDRAETERKLLHVYNMMVQRQGHVLFAGRAAPARWPVALPDLASRLAALPAVALGRPDEALIEAVLVKLFADRQLAVDATVVRYLVRRMERSFASTREIAAAIDRESLRGGRPITVPFAREVLEQVGFGPGPDTPE